MLIAVGMYLPFFSTAAIFVGGLVRWIFDARAKKAGASDEERTRGENMGTLVASGFIAGEALMAVLLAFLVLGGEFVPGLVAARQAVTPPFAASAWAGLLIYPVILYMLVWLPIQKMRDGGTPAVRVE
jgi:hypothetical protein